jgi:hypothetical protein
MSNVHTIESDAFVFGHELEHAYAGDAKQLDTIREWENKEKGYTLARSLQTIGSGAFQHCTSLMTINLEGTEAKVIKDENFRNCTALDNVYLNKELTKILYKRLSTVAKSLILLTSPMPNN